MRQFIITVLGVLTALFIALITVPALIAVALAPEEEPLPARMVVEIDLGAPLAEQPPLGLFPFADAAPLTLAGLHGGLAAAADDPDVAALYIRGGDGATGPAAAQEVLEAMAAFRAADKPVFAFTQDVAPGGLGDYLVLAQADRLWMQPTGSFLPAGLSLRSAFLKGTLDMIGVEPDFVQFRDYKGAADVFTESGLTDAQREANTALIEAVDEVLTGGIATARGLAPADFTALLERAPLSADAALDAGLADALAYEAAVREQVLAEAGEDADFVALAAYAADRDVFADGPVIAAVYGEGPIVPGETVPPGPFGGTAQIGSATMAGAIRDAADDEDVKAILVRITSPGGSASASDEVWDAIRAAREAGKPVVASMGAVAASGGYYIPAGADLIVANETTVTGSIGIVGGKFAVGGLLESVGVTVDAVSTTRNADIWAADVPFSEEQRAQFTRWLADGYADFKDRVARGRGMTPAEVEAVAQGRVWAGSDAAQRGLVDRLGGFGTALAAAREMAGLEAGADIELKTFPKPRSFQEELFGIAMNAEATVRGLSLLASLAADPDIAAAVREVKAAREAARGAQARAPVPELR